MARKDPITGATILDGWSTNVTLLSGRGSGKGTEPAARPTGPQQSLQCIFPFAGDFTIEFGIQPLEFDDAGGSAYIAEALVTLGVEGNYVTRRVSISNGTTLTGVAQSVKIVLWDTTPTGDPYTSFAFLTTGLKYNVSAQVALGTRPAKQVQPQLVPGPGTHVTASLGDVVNISPGFYELTAPGAAAIVPIPQDAGVNAVMVLVTYGAEASPPLTLQQGAATVSLFNSTLGQNTAAWYPLAEPATWVPIPPGSDTLFLSLTAGLPAMTVGTFTVFFAIDG